FAFAESSARSALNLAGASEQGFRVWLPGFLADATEDGWTIHGEGKDIRLDLQMPTPEAPLLHGRGGFSAKSEEAGKASYYYSLPNLPIQGTLRIGTQKYAVQGQAWMDHEFGSGQLGSKQRGWDWMGLPLGNKAALMVYRLRDSQDPQKDFISGTYVDPEGKAHSLSRGDIQLIPSQKWKSSRSGGEYPLAWQVKVPTFAVDLEVKANFPDQELDTRASTQVIYWEGSVTVQGRLDNLETKSLGYLEMTGYAQGFDQDI
ncbi:MAG: carotenoid 1,2-hydratase, partial [Deltaproteobacteria bacterium]|nr:carotenoid 1,2-hydratase [Deltaproteobacteria bacterium]